MTWTALSFREFSQRLAQSEIDEKFV